MSRLTDRELWEAGHTTRFQMATWKERDYQTHFLGIQHTLRFLMALIDEPKKRGRPPTGFDKKAYDRDRMRRIRAQRKLERNPGETIMVDHGEKLR